jgi:uncharacterized protein (TIGR02996 family)
MHYERCPNCGGPIRVEKCTITGWEDWTYWCPECHWLADRRGGIALWKAYQQMSEGGGRPRQRGREAKAFLRSVLERPDDDTPRLAFADWLGEHGEGARAEFIRAQCELQHLPGDDPRRARLLGRAKELLAAQADSWAGAVRTLALAYRFRRGFVDHVEIGPPLARHLAGLCRLQPVQSARLRQADDAEIRRLARAAALARLTELSLDGGAVSPEALAALVGSPHVRGLTSLSLRGCGIGPDGARVLAGAPQLGRLTSLDLGHTQIYGADPCCEDAVLLGEGIGDAGAEALAASPHLESLQTLRLRGCGIGDAGAHALAASRHLPRLCLLTLSDNPIGEQARQALRGRFGNGAVL